MYITANNMTINFLEIIYFFNNFMKYNNKNKNNLSLYH